MKRLLFAAIFLTSLLLPASAWAKANTVLIHPGETLYARFEIKGKKLKLTSYGKEKDESAQVIFTMGPDTKQPNLLYSLKIENKLPHDLVYKMEMRSIKRNLEMAVPVSPVVAGKVAFENYPLLVEVLAAYDFQLDL